MSRQKQSKAEIRGDPPAHLREAGTRLWARIRADFELTDAAELHLLALACEAADRAAEARQAIAEFGVVTPDRWGQPRANPATGVLRAAVDQQIAALRALGVTGSRED